MAERDAVGPSELQRANSWKKGLNVFEIGSVVKRWFRLRKDRRRPPATEPSATEGLEPIIEEER